LPTAQEAADRRYGTIERIVILTNPFISVSVTDQQYSSNVCVELSTSQDWMDVRSFDVTSVM
jgi:hypothetical protein